MENGIQTEETLPGAPLTAGVAAESAPAGAGEEQVTERTEETNGAVEEEPVAPDYAAMAEADLAEIKRLAPSLGGLGHLSELPNAARYAALRDAGLSVEEALWAACHRMVTRTAPYDNRSHLRASAPLGAAGNPVAMSAGEMQAARDLFSDLTDAEIERLYARCR